MKSFYIKQKFISLKDDFYVYNENEEQVYKIDGSFMKVPKTFTIYDKEHNERAHIERKPLSLLPTFIVEVEQSYQFKIKKQLSLFKARYSIEGEGVEVKGNFWDMDFTVELNGREIGKVSKEWLSLGDIYKIDVFDEAWEMIVITLVVAIDRVKEEKHTLWAITDF